MKTRHPLDGDSPSPSSLPPASPSVNPENGSLPDVTAQIGPPPERSAQEAHAAALCNFEHYLASVDKGEDKWSLNKAATEAQMDLAQLRTHLREAFANQEIQIRMPRNEKREKVLCRTWRGVEHYYVLNAAPGEELFFRGAAEVFFDVLRAVLDSRAADQKKQQQKRTRERKEPCLRIGIVSGRTTGGLINAICNHAGAWDSLLPMETLPAKICIYALNSSQTGGYQELKGNANVLAFLLAERFIAKIHESKSIALNARPVVEAFGLSAKLLQHKREVQETDCSPETTCVLRYTDPARLRASFEACGKPLPDDLSPLGDKSELDIVITGVGSARDSLFWRYGEENKLNHRHLVENELVVGDIAYSPVTRMGEIKQLLNKDNSPVEFYCAISLGIFREMSRDPQKRVVLVARNGTGNKTEAIHAAIASEEPLCNVMITDDPTAYDLLLRLSRLGG